MSRKLKPTKYLGDIFQYFPAPFKLRKQNNNENYLVFVSDFLYFALD